MKIELKNIHYAAFASEETYCYDAAIYVDGVKAGRCHNDGHGGATWVEPHDLRAKLDAYGKTLPPETYELDGETHSYAKDSESICDALMSEWLVARDLKRAMATKFLFTKPGANGIYETNRATREYLADMLHDAAKLERLRASLKADKILNALPFDEALALYRKAA